ncbi:hypothetical protein LOZ18_005743 [Ophidiomyces ophidiicola]|nr:hypothetical protein LOZ18_005743 [Ophidiomyces ophidiicola]
MATDAARAPPDSPPPPGSPKKRKRSRKADGDRKFDCQHAGCGKSYSRAEHLYRHQLNHNPKHIYRCAFPSCTRAFVRQDLCIRHQERHNTHGSQLQKRDSFVAHSAAAAGGGGGGAAVSTAGPPSPQCSPATATPATAPEPAPAAPPNAPNGAAFAPPPPPPDPAHYERPPAFNLFAPAFTPVGFSPPDLPAPSPARTAPSSHAAPPPPDYALSAGLAASLPDLDAMAAYALPIFGGETLDRSPFAMTDDFTAWLFSEPHASSLCYAAVPAVPAVLAAGPDPFAPAPPPPGYGFAPDPACTDGYTTALHPLQQLQQQQQQSQPPPPPPPPPQQLHPMSVTSLLDTVPPESLISPHKRSELVELIQANFTDQAAGPRQPDVLRDGGGGGGVDTDSHVLSLRMMQVYLESYWYHCHDQLPILHRPTFQPDAAPALLLLTLMALGAATLEHEQYGAAAADAAADLAHFVAWHLRWELFRHADFRPPARLWVFQALLLLETYEKMFATRALHERAHIHHDTTLTLMRRGSSLIGRAALDSPPPVPSSSSSSAPAAAATAPAAVDRGDEAWARWVKAEATRRAAFAAFVLDTIHATMFGHSAKMIAHELRLPLPCDEGLWAAASAAGVARVQAALATRGRLAPPMFLDGLKKTLNGQPVRTNSFGRTIIMSGLLSVSWHMNQRDLQVTSLGVTTAGDKWRAALLRAFDHWRRDFDDDDDDDDDGQDDGDDSTGGGGGGRPSYPPAVDVFFEARTVLHHLAHMAAHVDIVDCQIFAGARRLLGRSITPRDYSAARARMTERWATRPLARDAAFYALKFLVLVLVVPARATAAAAAAAATTMAATATAGEYSARSDFLLHRPWVLYFAALVVWCYGFALDGALPAPLPDLRAPAAQRRDMLAFLDRVGGVAAPADLERLRDRNRCLGLLMVLRDTFEGTRWELLQEAAALLGSCIAKLSGVPAAA